MEHIAVPMYRLNTIVYNNIVIYYFFLAIEYNVRIYLISGYYLQYYFDWTKKNSIK